MHDLDRAQWISTGMDDTSVFPVFQKEFRCVNIKKASLIVTALGVYEAYLNRKRIGNFVFAPGWTSYEKRLQVQRYNITSLLQRQNTLEIALGRGWYASKLGWKGRHPGGQPLLLLATIQLEDVNGNIQEIVTCSDWKWRKSTVLFSEIYAGEALDMRIENTPLFPCQVMEHSKEMLIEQEGEVVTEQERFSPIAVIHTVQGHVILDFGQEITGYVQFSVHGKSGQCVKLRHAEILHNGELYTENLRACKGEFSCILREGRQRVKPHFTFYGFRYVQVENWPEEVQTQNFTAIAVYSKIKQTGFFHCGHDKLNRLFHNILWGQRGNSLDVPTDCPQRDERLGWTGDVQAFCRAACYHFDVKRFYSKWLSDLRADQFENGGVPAVVPNVLTWRRKEPDTVFGDASAAWGDVACVCPWQLYLAYGDASLLSKQYESMRAWISYIASQNKQDDGLWVARGKHFGDWLGLDAPAGSYKGSTDDSLIATAMYANSVSMLIRAANALGKDAAAYQVLLDQIKAAFTKHFTSGGVLRFPTQTGYALGLCFHLFQDPLLAAKALAKLVCDNGTRLTTGFVGTPYLLHALSENGYGELAYTLLLQEEFPSWLYSVDLGATTIWEHWDGMRPDGSLWDPAMNSFNHCAYGAVSDWIFSVAAGIRPVETAPGYKKAIIAPLPDARLQHLSVQYQTPHGTISSCWAYDQGQVHYRVQIPDGIEATVVLGNHRWESVSGGIIAV